MTSTSKTLKQQQIATWVMRIKSCTKPVAVTEYCYNCIVSDDLKNKTLIVFPQEAERKEIIAINKAMEEVELLDIIKLCKKIRC